MKDITIGQFFPGESFLHKLDPRTKLLATLALMIIVFVSATFTGFAVFLSFFLLTVLASGIRLRVVLRGIKPVLLIILFTFFLNLFFQTQGETLVCLGSFRITDHGLHTAFFLAARLALLIVSTQMLTLTTSPIALTDAMESLLRPLERFRFPAHEIAMMMSIALRFIPTLLDEAEKIKRAQMSRGADFQSGNLIYRAKAMIPLLVPLFISAFRRAEDLALAMESRCYRGGEGRTRMRQLRYGVRDFISAGLLLCLLELIILTNYCKLP